MSPSGPGGASGASPPGAPPGRTTIVALGPGSADALPAAAVAALAAAGGGVQVVTPAGTPAELAGALPLPVRRLAEGEEPPRGAVVAAVDAVAHRLALARPGAATVPDRERLRDRAIAAEVARLAAVGRRLRRECPWDREQTAASIVPHTVEEAFEVAEAVAAGDAAHQADELGDLLFQSVFLAQLMEETGDADLGSIAGGQADKLISRHPHVYGERIAADAAHVLDLWERRKREERAGEGIFHELPPGLPSLAFAVKVVKRAAAAGFAFPDAGAVIAKLQEEVGELAAEPGPAELGDVLLAAVAVARQIGADPELALRASAHRFRARVQRAADLCAAAGGDFEALGPDEQLAWYARSRAPSAPARGA